MVYKVNSFKHNSTPDYFTLKSVWLEGTNKKKIHLLMNIALQRKVVI